MNKREQHDEIFNQKLERSVELLFKDLMLIGSLNLLIDRDGLEKTVQLINESYQIMFETVAELNEYQIEELKLELKRQALKNFDMIKDYIMHFKEFRNKK